VLLQALRQGLARRYPWIDSICIDQQNLTEKSSQVSMMGEIYGSAAHVNFCLGQGNEETDLLFDCIQEYAAYIHEHEYANDFFDP